jgi:hypothetical protein
MDRPVSVGLSPAERDWKATEVTNQLRSARYQLARLEERPFSQRAADWSRNVELQRRHIVALEAELDELRTEPGSGPDVPPTRAERIEQLALSIGSLRARLDALERSRSRAVVLDLHDAKREVAAVKIRMAIEPLEAELRTLIAPDDPSTSTKAPLSSHVPARAGTGARGRPCSICVRGDRVEIERAVDAGDRSVSGVAAGFGVGKDALHRHLANHRTAGSAAPVETGARR